jgi:MerR family transcriptional regulator, mercuric resistance operon regulatory protein
MTRTYTIGELAAAASVNVETVRYYQRRGLLREPARPLRGIRRYSDADTQQLRFIKRAQLMGFALAEVESLLSLRGRVSCQATRELAVAKLKVIDSRIDELSNLRDELASLVEECAAAAVDGNCPILEHLDLNGSG